MRASTPKFDLVRSGTIVSDKIKRYLFGDNAWTPRIACYVAWKLQEVKMKAKTYYPNLSEEGLLEEMENYDLNEFLDKLSPEVVEDLSQPTDIKDIGKIIVGKNTGKKSSM